MDAHPDTIVLIAAVVYRRAAVFDKRGDAVYPPRPS